ncbi:carbohydrate ABC transporter permease [Nonomuraea sp. NPDC049152]|uniref:carbohydrate ABC transporter permease n=1 Tax=Nonomuraea sp. NPDC049152 TaxID=3154350 RepID=UPI0033D94F99
MRALHYATLTVIAALCTAPLLFMVSMSLSSDATSARGEFSLFPTEWEFGNFVAAFTSDLPTGSFLLNSVILTGLAVAGQVFVSAMVAYAFARLRAPGKNALFVVLLSTLMLPAEITLIPQFTLFSELGWVDTLLPLIVPNFFGGAYNIFLMRQFVSRIPRELDEAASLDGLGYFRVFTRIVLPMMKPALIAVGIFTFSWNWGWFMGPLIYLSSQENMPLALGVQVMYATGGAGQAPPWNLVMVGSLLLTLPMIVVYFFGQKYMHELSVTAGSDQK